MQRDLKSGNAAQRVRQGWKLAGRHTGVGNDDRIARQLGPALPQERGQADGRIVQKLVRGVGDGCQLERGQGDFTKRRGGPGWTSRYRENDCQQASAVLLAFIMR